jgi:Notch-like protein
MHDGTTPLILAARLAVEGMLEDLINSHADVNAVDDLGRPELQPSYRGHQPVPGLLSPNPLSPLFASFPGKSALHWAAAVNNVDAAVVLLKNGANKDMQNNKVSRRAA